MKSIFKDGFLLGVLQDAIEHGDATEAVRRIEKRAAARLKACLASWKREEDSWIEQEKDLKTA